jgi:ABC-type glycerol-3-phosphate transport system substrate-binding protein
MKYFLSALVLFCGIAVLAGCSGGSGGQNSSPVTSTPAPTPTPVPGFTFTIGPSGSVEVVSPVSGTYTPVTLTLTSDRN